MYTASPAEVAFVRGKSENAREEYSKHAEDWLTKAVKLDPSNSSAWISLAQCAWKKGAIQQAKSLLIESLNHGETPEALQDLSMIVRQIKIKGESPSVSIDESINYAKKAITMNVNDHKSWYILGNAHYMRFFTVSQDVGDLKKSLTAYARSESLGGDCNPDLFFNRGNVYRYLQDYSAACMSYTRTVDIDPSFSAATEASESVVSFIKRANEMVTKRGWFQKKRIDRIIQNLTTSRHANGCVGLNALSHGSNDGVTVAVSVLMPATTGDIPPECFLCIDKNGMGAIVAIYNIGHDAPPPSPELVLTISNPIVSRNALDVIPNSLTAETTTVASLPPTTPAVDSATPPTTPESVELEVVGGALLLQAFSLDNVKVDGRVLNRRAVAPPQLVVNLSDI